MIARMILIRMQHRNIDLYYDTTWLFRYSCLILFSSFGFYLLRCIINNLDISFQGLNDMSIYLYSLFFALLHSSISDAQTVQCIAFRLQVITQSNRYLYSVPICPYTPFLLFTVSYELYCSFHNVFCHNSWLNMFLFSPEALMIANPKHINFSFTLLFIIFHRYQM